MAEKDSRIKIVNNDKNRGLLYSRAMGILNSSGEYLMNLDPDDEIKGVDSLEYLYKLSKNLNLDIISFNALDKTIAKKKANADAMVEAARRAVEENSINKELDEI